MMNSLFKVGPDRKSLLRMDTNHVVLLAVDLPVDVVERFAAEGPAARGAHEAVGVVELAHGLARVPRPAHLLPARHAVA